MLSWLVTQLLTVLRWSVSKLFFVRWAMNGLLTFLIKTVPALLATVIVALLGPLFATMGGTGIVDMSLWSSILTGVAALYAGTTVNYTQLLAAGYAQQDATDLVTGAKGIFDAVLTNYKITLAAADLGTLLSAISSRLATRYPPAPPA